MKKLSGMIKTDKDDHKNLDCIDEQYFKIASEGQIMEHTNLSASEIVRKKLKEATRIHEATLAGLTSLTSSRSSSSVLSSSTSAAAAAAVPKSLAELAWRRSHCPQPPLDDAHLGGGSAILADEGIVTGIQLNPPERVAPHRLLFPSTPDHPTNETELGDGASSSSSLESIVFNSTIKALTALSALWDETHELEEIAFNEFLPQIVLFGSDLQLHLFHKSSLSAVGDKHYYSNGNQYRLGNNSTSTTHLLDEISTQKRDSELLRRMGLFLPVLQKIHNFTTRCQRLLRNMVCQIGGSALPLDYQEILHMRETTAQSITTTNEHNLQSSFEDLPPNSNNSSNESHVSSSNRWSPTASDGSFGRNINLVPMGKAIATILKILIAIDCAISHNKELREAWDLYKCVVSDKSKQLQTNKRLLSSSSKISLNKLLVFERMLVQLDMTLLSSRCFAKAIEQNFDPDGYFYSRNSGEFFPLHEEIKTLLTTLFKNYCARINTDNEMDERKAMIGVYGMYCLYRRLLPSNLEPDAKLHKTLWASFPSTCPIIHIYGHLAFIPTAFLTRYAPLDRVRGVVVDPVELKAEAVELLNKRDKVFCLNVSKLYKETLSWLVTVETELAPSDDILGEVGAVANAHSTIESPFAQENFTGIVEEKTITLLKGLLIAQCASTTLSSYLIMHRSLEIPIQSDHISAIIQLCAILKSIDKIIRVRRRAAVVSLHKAALKMVSSSIFRRFDSLRSTLDRHTGSINQSFDTNLKIKMARINAYLSVIETILKGSSSFSPARRYSLELTLCVCRSSNGNSGLMEEDAMACDSLLRHLGMISDIDQHFKDICDCSILYFHRELFPPMIDHIYRSCKSGDVGHFQLVASAFSDAERLLLKSVSYYQSSNPNEAPEIIRLYQSFFVKDCMFTKLIHPVAIGIEDDLRISVMSMNDEDLECPNPKQKKNNNLKSFLEMPKVLFCGIKIDVKSAVEKNLEKTFYDLSTKSLYDAHLYQQMSMVAKAKYDLNIIDNLLPCVNSEQEIDIVSIINNIDDFASEYNYNMNQQIFVERRAHSGSELLHTINIHSVFAFLGKHGVGIVKNAMNQIYRLISCKFQLLSKVLVEDYLRSLISKEQRWFDEKNIEGNHVYSFDRAFAFAHDIKSLNRIEYDGSCLDHCIKIITQIGNALGLVRLIRSGELNHKSKSLQYITGMSSYQKYWNDFDESSRDQCHSNSFHDLLFESSSNSHFDTNNHISSVLRNFDEIIQTSLSGCSRSSDYLNILLNVFKDILNDSNHEHLENFFLLVPAACLGWLEKSSEIKEEMKKEYRMKELYYVDDGFAMGVAFILNILDQNEIFDNLGWFDDIKRKLNSTKTILLEKKAKEESKLFASATATKQSSYSFFKSKSSYEQEQRLGDELESQQQLSTIQVTERRLDMQTYELEILCFSIKSARIFFKKETDVRK